MNPGGARRVGLVHRAGERINIGGCVTYVPSRVPETVWRGGFGLSSHKATKLAGASLRSRLLPPSMPRQQAVKEMQDGHHEGLHRQSFLRCRQ